MSEIFDKINALVKKAPENRHSYFQLKYFILGKQHTTQKKLWQCLTELESRKETMDSLTMQIEDLKDDLSLSKLQTLRNETNKTETNYGDKEIGKIVDQEKVIRERKTKRKEESIENNINKLEKQLEFVTQEARFFVQAFEALEKIEPLKDFDDYEAQAEYWEAKVSEEINLRLLFHQPISPDTLKTALCLHEDSRVKQEVIKMIDRVEKASVKMLKESNEKQNIIGGKL